MSLSISHKGLGIPLELLNTDELKSLKEELCVSPIAVPGYSDDPIPYPVYRINTKKIYIPKFYRNSIIEKLIKEHGLVSKERIGVVIGSKFKGTLRNDQKMFINQMLTHVSKNDAGLGCAKTGAGKTVMTIDIISRIKVKTLIVVHKEFLLNQWIERINQFMPDVKVGTIRGPIIDVEGCDIVIGMLQSLSMKEYDQKVFDDFGLVVVDECHHICSKTFSKALFKISTKKMIGLSATPIRKDGLTRVLNWFLGPIIEKEVDLSNEQAIDVPSVKIVPAVYDTDIVVKYIHRNGKRMTNSADLINQITSDSARNELIVSEIINAHNDGRKILVLSDRRTQCLDIQHLLGLKDISSGLYLGSMKPEKLEETNKMDIILATYAMASEGYDNAKLDTCVFASSKGDIVQSCGRILRKRNENSPLIIDITDIKYHPNQVKTRKTYYKKQGFVVFYAEGPGGPGGPSDSIDESDDDTNSDNKLLEFRDE